MSWDINVVGEIDGNPVYLGDWNYTMNCSAMIHKAMGRRDRKATGAWWTVIRGLPCLEADIILSEIIQELRDEPQDYIPMNPTNGWGDYDGLVEILTNIRDTCAKYPSAKVEASG